MREVKSLLRIQFIRFLSFFDTLSENICRCIADRFQRSLMSNRKCSTVGKFRRLDGGELNTFAKLVMNTIFFTVYSVKNCDHFHMVFLLGLW